MVVDIWKISIEPEEIIGTIIYREFTGKIMATGYGETVINLILHGVDTDFPTQVKTALENAVRLNNSRLEFVVF